MLVLLRFNFWLQSRYEPDRRTDEKNLTENH